MIGFAGLPRVPSFVWQAGGDILNADGTATALDKPESAAGIQFLQDLIWKHKVMADPAASDFQARTEARILQLLEQIFGTGSVTIQASDFDELKRTAPRPTARPSGRTVPRPPP